MSAQKDERKRATPPDQPISEARLWPFADGKPYFSVDVNPAEWAHQRLTQYIKDFEDNLDEEHEIAVRLVSHGFEPVIHINHLGYHGPDLITFSGVTVEGERVQLVQHVSQISMLLLAAKKIHEKPTRIGFTAEQGS